MLCRYISYDNRKKKEVSGEDVQKVIKGWNDNYLPPRRRNSKSDLTDYQPKSGTKVSYDYALKKGKIIINVK